MKVNALESLLNFLGEENAKVLGDMCRMSNTKEYEEFAEDIEKNCKDMTPKEIVKHIEKND